MESRLTVRELISSYDALLIDAFGVLVNGAEAIPNAPGFIAHLNQENVPFRIVTNDASRKRETLSRLFEQRGFAIPASQIITAASLLSEHVERRRGKNPQLLTAIVLGTPDSIDIATKCGLHVIDAADGGLPDFVIVADESGFDFLPTVDRVLTKLIALIDDRRHVELIVPNPDGVYPKASDAYGFAARSVAELLLFGVREARPDASVTVTTLGKPNPIMFEVAMDSLETRNVLMIGDQAAKDIAGANSVGIDSLWVRSGIGTDAESTYIADDIGLDTTVTKTQRT